MKSFNRKMMTLPGLLLLGALLALGGCSLEAPDDPSDDINAPGIEDAGARYVAVGNSLTAGFTIAGGVLQNDDLLMTTPFAEVTGKGKLGLGARTITYGLRAKADVGGQMLTVPILIKGPWADPKISLDLESLAKERLDVEKEQLEAEARTKAKALEAETKAKAKAKLEKELGVVQQEGESLEEAVKRRGEEIITDEAAKALERLLGGGN